MLSAHRLVLASSLMYLHSTHLACFCAFTGCLVKYLTPFLIWSKVKHVQSKSFFHVALWLVDDDDVDEVSLMMFLPSCAECKIKQELDKNGYLHHNFDSSNWQHQPSNCLKLMLTHLYSQKTWRTVSHNNLLLFYRLVSEITCSICLKTCTQNFLCRVNLSIISRSWLLTSLC